MKVGLSLSRCIKDIVQGRVDINDVLVLVTRTDFDVYDEDQWKSIWEGYNVYNPEWYGLDHDEVRNTVLILWDRGKIHQPRKFGSNPQRLPYYWLEVGLQTDDIESNPSVKQAWEQFQVLAGLASKESRVFNDDF